LTLQRVLDRRDEFPQSKVAGTGERRQNIPLSYRIVKIKSVKTREDAGNSQLTIAKATDTETQEDALAGRQPTLRASAR
jgi:hypothetical protein